ncbi:MAG: hypothetical protein AAGH41_13470 [Pseudomonadota bacterium]
MSADPSPLQLRGEIKVGEAQSLAAEIQRRQLGSPRHFTLVLAACILVSIVAVFLANMAFGKPLENSFLPAVGAVIGALIYKFISTRLVQRQFQAAMQARYGRDTSEFVAEITDEEFRFADASVTYAVRWDAISEVFLKDGYWVLLVWGSYFVLPQRLFRPNQEKLFIDALTERLSQGTVNRSTALNQRR